MRRAATLLLALGALASATTSCPKGTQASYFVVDNTVLLTKESIEFKEFSEEECQSTCSTNVDPSGKSIECGSFSYDHVSFTCTVYETKSKPLGEGQATHAVGRRFFEKFCLPASVSSTCAEAQFIRADDSVLIGFAANVSLVDSIEECVQTCALEAACKSAMYFYEEGECITNTESALSRPNSFAREETEKVIYFQNGCLTRSAFVEASATPRAVEAVDSESKPNAEKAYALPRSAEESVSAEIIDDEAEEEEEPSTTAATKKRKTTTTTTEEPQEGEYEENEEPSTTAPSKKSRKEKEHDVAKYKKHPKNFGSKTVHYKQKKGDKSGVPKVDALEEAAEEVNAASESAEEETTEVDNSDPYTTFFSEWSDWTPCKQSGERRIRRRKCLDLRRCLGALMQVENCPAITTAAPSLVTEEEIKSVRSIVGAPLEGDALGGIDTITSAPQPSAEIAAAGAEIGNGYIWSPWLGTCQKFASGQPCNSGEMIGFESRECVAKDPAECQGPFFRYCTLPC